MKLFLQLIGKRRFRKVFGLFLSVVFQLWWLGKVKGWLNPEKVEKRYKELYKAQATRFTNLALELEGLLIKLGQFFSSRGDILPLEYTDELSKLQDAVTPMESKAIFGRIGEELGSIEKNFSSIEESPLAAASLGQVHKAFLHSGEEVVVKVLKPGIEIIIQVDLETLRLILACSKVLTKLSNSVDLDLLYQEFKETLSDELDYIKEAKNLERFKTNFVEETDIYVPKVYKEFSTSKVLTMEYVQGTKINDIPTLKGKGIDTKALAGNLVASYLKQVLVDGFYHADPHPGNLLVKDDGKIVFLDFGMVGRIQADMKENFLNLIFAVGQRNPQEILDSIVKLGFIKGHADRDVLVKGINMLLLRFYGDEEAFKRINLNEFILELREFMYSQPFQIPAQTTFLGKALNTIIGLCNTLDKDFDMGKELRPYIQELVLEDKEIQGRAFDNILGELSGFIQVPQKLNRLVDGLESGSLRIHPARSFEERFFKEQEQLNNRLVNAVLSMGFLISAILLFGMDYQIVAYTLISISTYLILKIGFRKPKRRGISKRSRQVPPGFKKPKGHL